MHGQAPKCNIRSNSMTTSVCESQQELSIKTRPNSWHTVQLSIYSQRQQSHSHTIHVYTTDYFNIVKIYMSTGNSPGVYQVKVTNRIPLCEKTQLKSPVSFPRHYGVVQDQQQSESL